MSTILKIVFPKESGGIESIMAKFDEYFPEWGVSKRKLGPEDLWIHPSFGYMQEVGVHVGYPYFPLKAEKLFDDSYGKETPRLINERIPLLLKKMDKAKKKLEGTSHHDAHLATIKFIELAYELGLDLELSF